VLARILGEALGLPAARFDVRHADTAASGGVGTWPRRNSHADNAPNSPPTS
jgi:hypothetical protein